MPRGMQWIYSRTALQCAAAANLNCCLFEMSSWMLTTPSLIKTNMCVCTALLFRAKVQGPSEKLVKKKKKKS